MKTSVVLGAVSAGLVAAELLSPPDNFPTCGTTCFGNMLGQASQLGCGSGGSTEDAVDGACLCKNIDFSYGIIDCANAACPQGVASTVVQYGVDWCAEKGVVVGGLNATPDPSVASSASTTIAATGGSGDGGSDSGASSATTSLFSGTGTLGPIITTEIIATSTNSDGAVVTTTLTSQFTATSDSATGSGTESESATDSSSASDSTTFVTESTITAGGSTVVTSVTTTAPVSSTEDTTPTTTDSNGGSFQTAAPVGLVAAAGLAALML
ncbi:hypothetical protein F5B21DRAFT_100376 [Xylaria acuta]|nr:hypothetical protein F5B21DRAFT_100376 [Xylaria acuta]